MLKQKIKNLLIITLVIHLFNTNTFAQEKIKIDIVSDITCPWCAIGFKRLSNAIKELNIEDKVEIEWHPFQLNPDMPKEAQNANKYLMNKLNLSEEQLVKKRTSMKKRGEKSGFEFNYFEEMVKPNTFNAHVLLDYAKEFNKQTELKVRLQEAYFGERKNIDNREILKAELKAVGLNVNEAIARLDNKVAIKRVQDEEKLWRDRGVFAVPTMVFDKQIVRRGANETEYYKKLLSHIINSKK